MLGAMAGNFRIVAVDLTATPSFQNMLFVEIPEYRNKHIRTSVKVNFYVINGKRKRSQPQHFTYHPGELSRKAPWWEGWRGQGSEGTGQPWAGGSASPSLSFLVYHVAPCLQELQKSSELKCSAQQTAGKLIPMIVAINIIVINTLF